MSALTFLLENLVSSTCAKTLTALLSLFLLDKRNLQIVLHNYLGVDYAELSQQLVVGESFCFVVRDGQTVQPVRQAQQLFGGVGQAGFDRLAQSGCNLVLATMV
jgi:hypothetical protein